MTGRVRIVLILVGLLLVGFSLAALVFAWSPVEVLGAQSTLAPTLFVPPPGGSP